MTVLFVFPTDISAIFSYLCYLGFVGKRGLKMDKTDWPPLPGPKKDL